MFKGVDIGIQQVAYCILIQEYVLLAYTYKKNIQAKKQSLGRS